MSKEISHYLLLIYSSLSSKIFISISFSLMPTACLFFSLVTGVEAMIRSFVRDVHASKKELMPGGYIPRLQTLEYELQEQGL